MSWQELGAVAPERLKDARLQLHWAAQIIGATARSLIEPTFDDSHTSASWSADGKLLESQPTRTDPPVKGSGEARSINIGMSPGDDTYEGPYWYVSPWPYPRDPKLAELESGGHWHTEGFLAAVLPAGRIVGAGGQQEAAARSFVDSAIRGTALMLGGGK